MASRRTMIRRALVVALVLLPTAAMADPVSLGVALAQIALGQSALTIGLAVFGPVFCSSSARAKAHQRKPGQTT